LAMMRSLPEPAPPMVIVAVFVQKEPKPVTSAVLLSAVAVLPITAFVSINTPELVMERKLFVPVLPTKKFRPAFVVTPSMIVVVLSSAQDERQASALARTISRMVLVLPFMMSSCEPARNWFERGGWKRRGRCSS